jgi:hypothetical protein
MRISTAADAAAVPANAVAADVRTASQGKTTNATPMPIGQLLTRMANAVPISRPANQSVVILVSRTLSSTAPVPPMRRPANRIA